MPDPTDQMACTPRHAPSRRSLLRAAAWTVPVVSVAAAAPAYACSPASATTTPGALDWDGAQVTYSRTSATLATAKYTKAGAADLTVTIRANYSGNMKSGAEFAQNGNSSLTRQAVVGGLGIGGLRLEQSTTSSSPQGRNDRGSYTFEFSRPVTGLSFHVTDIDSAWADFRDGVQLTAGFTELSKADRLIGAGTQSQPYRTNYYDGAVNNVDSGQGNVHVQYAGPVSTLTIDFWNVALSYDSTVDTDQVIYISDLTFNYASC